jgi:tetratricopeptide (TPR) repeat protein
MENARQRGHGAQAARANRVAGGTYVPKSVEREAPEPVIRRPRSAAILCGVVLFAIASGCGGPGKNDSKGQEASVAERVAAAQGLADPADRANELTGIGVTRAEAKDLAGASETLALAARAADQIRDPQSSAAVFTTLGGAQVMADDRLAASRSLARAEAAAAKIAQPTFRAEAHVKLANLQALLRSKAVAFSTLQAVAQESLDSAAHATGRPADPEFNADLALSGDVNMLLRVAVVYEKLGGKDEARRTIDEAMRIVDKVKDDRDRSLALAYAGKALASLGQQDRSRTTFEGALAAARTIGTQLSRAYALKDIAVQLSDSGQHAKAREVFDEAEKAAQRVAEVDLQKQALDEIERARSEVRGRVR